VPEHAVAFDVEWPRDEGVDWLPAFFAGRAVGDVFFVAALKPVAAA
jgi:hypothetical protein